MVRTYFVGSGNDELMLFIVRLGGVLFMQGWKNTFHLLSPMGYLPNCRVIFIIGRSIDKYASLTECEFLVVSLSLLMSLVSIH
jgi:hypothetical protein